MFFGVGEEFWNLVLEEKLNEYCKYSLRSCSSKSLEDSGMERNVKYVRLSSKGIRGEII